MKKKELERAIGLFDTIPGAGLVDNYMTKLYKHEIHELADFIKKVTTDIYNTYKESVSLEYTQDIKKTYLVQLSEIHQCKITFIVETESAETIYDARESDIALQFRTFEKSTWVDQFVITGEGKYGGINIDEYKDWDLLLRFLFEKKKDSAMIKPSNEQVIAKKIDDLLENVDIKD